MYPADSNPPRRWDRVDAHPVYENFSVIPVRARLIKLTIMTACRMRLRREKR
jgi:hypothetical protein